MIIIWYVIILCCNAMNIYATLTHSDLVAISSIEKAIKQLVEKKPFNWQTQAQLRINQLEKQYTPKGYTQDKVDWLRETVSPAVIYIDKQPEAIHNVPQKDSTEQEETTETQTATKTAPSGETPTQKADEQEREEQKIDQQEIEKESETKKETTEQSPQEQEKLPYAQGTTSIEDIEEDVPSGEISTIEQEPISTTPTSPEIEITDMPFDEAPSTEPQETTEDTSTESSEQPITPHSPEIPELLGEQPTEQEEQGTVTQEPLEPSEPEKEPEETQPLAENTETEETTEPEAVKQIDTAAKIDEITNALNQLTVVPAELKNSEWEKRVNALIFELSLYDKEKAHDYVAQIYVRAGTIPTVIYRDSPPSVGTPPPPPFAAPALPKPGGPPAPPLPPLVSGGPKPPPLPLPGGPKLPPKAPAITLGSLRKMSEQDLMTLFEKHLVDLDKNWNEMSNEVIKVKTVYGTKTEMIRGVPELAWGNTLNTIKKVVIEKGIMPEVDVHKKIDERIKAVREEKVKTASQRVVKEEKVSEEITQKDLENQLEELFANPQSTQISWLVSVKSAIKKLDAFDHAQALHYQEKYIEVLPKEKRFIKP